MWSKILSKQVYKDESSFFVTHKNVKGHHWRKDPNGKHDYYDLPEVHQEVHPTTPFGKILTGVDTHKETPKEPSSGIPTKVDLESLDSDKKINEALYTARQEYFTAKNSKQDLTTHLNNLDDLINHSKKAIGTAHTINLWDDSESKVKKDTNSSIPHDSFDRVKHEDMIYTTPEAIEHISKHLSEDTEPQWESLTKDQESALTWYTRHGDEVMNPIVSDPAKFDSLSDPKARVNPKTLGVSREHLEDICDPDDLKAIRSEVLKSIKSLDEATTNMHLPSDHLLYRAVDLNHFKGQIPQDIVDNVVKHNTDKDHKSLIKELNKLEGLNFTDPSYGSTSIDKAVAHNFLNTHSRVVLEIAAPKGTKGSWIGDKSSFEEEKEFLMPRSTKYAIVGVRHGVDHVHLQVSIIS